MTYTIFYRRGSHIEQKSETTFVFRRLMLIDQFRLGTGQRHTANPFLSKIRKFVNIFVLVMLFFFYSVSGAPDSSDFDNGSLGKGRNLAQLLV